MTKRTKAILSLGGVFLLGALCGALALGTFVRGEVRSAHRLRDSSGFREYFIEQLELTAAQRDSLQGELDWFYREIAGLRVAAAGQYHDLIDSLDTRLVGHLSPRQVGRLRATEQRLRKQLEARRPHAVIEDVDAAPSSRDTVGATASKQQSRPTTKVAAEAKETQSSRDDSTANVPSLPAESVTETPDPGDEINRAGLREKLGLSEDQMAGIRTIMKGTRREIRRDVASMRGYPRLQLEAINRHLRAMDRDINALLDDSQRLKYAPVRDQIVARMRIQLMNHLKKLHGGMPRRVPSDARP